ncbi:hypothetical protein HA402_016136 [Bradysia odoriphaga]|nr:hypothetical protein HA402_016136 [Bradysia odoriphaga]
MSPRRKEKFGLITWTKMETSQLIASIKAQLKKHDPLPYSKRISLLNWDEISIPRKSVRECKGHLDLLIKKIHRTRTLEEILSEVNVEPVDVICVQNGGDNSINNNENSPVTRCCSRRSKRLSENERRGSEEYSQGRSHLDPFALFAKHNWAELANNKSLKERYDKLDDGEKLFWIRKAADASKYAEVKNILTDDKYVLLQKDRQEKSESVNPSNDHKRKLVENGDDANQSSKKVRKLEETSVDGQICSSSTADIEMEENGTEISSLNDTAGDEAAETTADATDGPVTDTTETAQMSSISRNENNSLVKLNLVGGTVEPEEDLKIGSTQGLLNFPGSTSGTTTFTGHSESWINSEDGFKIEEVGEFKSDLKVKEEHIESCCQMEVMRSNSTNSPRAFSRIRTICAGLFGRLGLWTIKKE